MKSRLFLMTFPAPLCLALALCVLSPSRAGSAEKPFRLASLFSDNMVLQQQSSVPVWGWGTPGERVSISASWGRNAATEVSSDSSWSLQVPTPGAGGPFTVIVEHSGARTTISNVLVGEVWVCSGQSNMEMALAGWPPADTILNSREEIALAALPSIRMYTVTKAFSAKPEAVCEGAWQECSPATAGGFSATAYFFGKRLHESLGVPVGLIHTSWGGTPVESWLGGKFLSELPQYDTTLQRLSVSEEGQRRLMDWLNRLPVIDMRHRTGENRWTDLDFNDKACSSRRFDDGKWRRMNLPTVWETTDLGNFDGAVWFRKAVALPPDWLRRDLVLNIGPVDDMDATYVNGERVGAHEGEGQWNVPRSYRIPARLVDSTVVQIAVRAIDNQGGGGIYGTPDMMSLRPAVGDGAIPLAGEWKYLPVAEYTGNRFYVYGADELAFEGRPRLSVDFSSHTPTVLYNGMIAPLVPYSIRGFIWYQGESNTGNPEEYKQLFPLLIRNWRNDFASEAPFYFVQIAPYNYGPSTHAELLREAQMSALSLESTGMAVTLDIGDPENIHPANKRDVGGRLAAWALAKTYGKPVPHSGPIFASAEKRQGALEVSFTHAEGGLVLKPAQQLSAFQIAGDDRIFRDAVVQVKGENLVVSHPEISSPAAVRYAFTNAPAATLFNAAGLPAAPFRTDDWK
jgi:sialate O-acetylesterase